MTNKVNIAVVTISVGSETMFSLLIVDCYVQTDILFTHDARRKYNHWKNHRQNEMQIEIVNFPF